MRVIGHRKVEDIRLRMPTIAEIAASCETVVQAPRVIPKGVVLYRSHEEANKAMEEWIVDGVAKKALERSNLVQR